MLNTERADPVDCDVTHRTPLWVDAIVHAFAWWEGEICDEMPLTGDVALGYYDAIHVDSVARKRPNYTAQT